MIVVTIGTNEQPFDRLIRAARSLERDDLFVQYGSSREAHGHGEWVEFLTFDELSEKASAARAVVCHAGVGSIMMARRCGHRPIVMARRHHLGEAVDDHQLFLARRLAKSGIVTLVEDEHELAAALAAEIVGEAEAASPLAGTAALSASVRSVLDGLGAARLEHAA
jgi:UDP-N-acetylglucosamine transferase subunit ALG13